jgi:predicted pyridoxine 5'-phosphate oxidase superfamily flavin-nucleotide-binding protein
MGHKFAQLMFTEAAQKLQQQHGSRQQYERMEKYGPSHDQLGPHEIDFIEARDSFYMASIGENDWPYVQHRGGPAGLLKVIGERTLAFADYSGNKQYVTIGNLQRNDRVTLFLIDYARQARLKIIGHAEVVETSADPELTKRIGKADTDAKVERIVRIRVAAFDWNCPQHITPRYTREEIEKALDPLTKRMEDLEKENESLRAQLKQAESSRCS